MWRLRSQAHRGGGFRSSSQAPLDALHFRFEDDVSAGDERLDVSEAEILEQRPQVVHFDRAAADVDGAQKCYAPWHTPRAQRDQSFDVDTRNRKTPHALRDRGFRRNPSIA